MSVRISNATWVYERFLEGMEELIDELYPVVPWIVDKLVKIVGKMRKRKEFLFHPYRFMLIFRSLHAYGLDKAEDIPKLLLEYYESLLNYVHDKKKKHVNNYIQFVKSQLAEDEVVGNAGEVCGECV